MGHADLAGLQFPRGERRQQLSQRLCGGYASAANGFERLQGGLGKLQAIDHVVAQGQGLPDALHVRLHGSV
ncbi:hypothetical protein D9M71_840700 [compost metagenome]